MTTGRGGAGRIPEPGGDHGYDEAHQDLPRGTADPVEAGPTPPPPEDLGGDYGYDEAHDFRT